MKKFLVGSLSLFVLVSAASLAEAKVKVFACVPEWATLATAIGGDRVEVTLATSALENPESVKPTPGMISALQGADLIVCTGAELEHSWLPVVIERAGNPKVSEGQPGHFMASEYVEILRDESKGLGHSHKHFHDNGNPHIQGDPRNIQRIAAQLAKRLIEIDPDGKALYTERAKAFITDLRTRIADLEKKAAPLRGVNVAVQHENALYLLKWLGIETGVVLEPEAGVEPGPSHLAKVLKAVPDKQIKFVVCGAYENPVASKYVSDKTGIPLITIPVTVGGTPEAIDLFSFYEDTIERLLDGLAGRERS